MRRINQSSLPENKNSNCKQGSSKGAAYRTSGGKDEIPSRGKTVKSENTGMSGSNNNTPARSPWLAAMAASLAVSFVLGLCMVWINTQRTSLGYELKHAQSRYADFVSYSSKLEVERDRLLSPYHLQVKAREFGMHNAKPGQIRRLP